MKINKLNIVLDCRALDDRFDIFSIAEGSRPLSVATLDGLMATDASMLSFGYADLADRRTSIVMYPSDASRRALPAYDERALSLSQLPTADAANLLAAALPRLLPHATYISFANGKLYFRYGDMQPKKRQALMPDGSLAEFFAIRVTISKRSLLSLNVSTFSNVKLASEVFGKRLEKMPELLDREPKYRFDGFRLTCISGSGDAYINKVGYRKRDRNVYGFSGFDAPSFEHSRSQVIVDLLESFQEAYGPSVALAFVETPVSSRIPFRKLLKLDPAFFAKVGPVSIEAHDEMFSETTPELETVLEGMGIEVVPDSPTLPRFEIIHDKVHYRLTSQEDAYRSTTEVPVQHLTSKELERALASSKPNKPSAYIRCSVKELAIKEDCVEGACRHFPIVGWKAFAMPVRAESCATLLAVDLLEVDPDGRLTFSRCVRNELGDRALRHFGLLEEEGGAAVMSLEDADGILFAISETPYIVIPDDLAKMSEETSRRACEPSNEKKKPSGSIRSIASGDGEMYDGLLGTNAFKLDGSATWFYSVGLRGYPKASMPRAVRIRSIREEYGDSFDPAPILDLMEVPFVRLDSPTVIPFPAKMIREYKVLNGLADAVAEDQ